MQTQTVIICTAKKNIPKIEYSEYSYKNVKLYISYNRKNVVFLLYHILNINQQLFIEYIEKR